MAPSLTLLRFSLTVVLGFRCALYDGERQSDSAIEGSTTEKKTAVDKLRRHENTSMLCCLQSMGLICLMGLGMSLCTRPSEDVIRCQCLAHRNRSDFCNLRLRCPSRTPEIARFLRQEKAMLHCNARVRWKVASDLRFRAAISEAKTPSFCRISGDLAPSTRKSLAIAIVRFWCAKAGKNIKNPKIFVMTNSWGIVGTTFYSIGPWDGLSRKGRQKKN